jgi:periplasmic protein TonB
MYRTEQRVSATGIVAAAVACVLIALLVRLADNSARTSSFAPVALVSAPPPPPPQPPPEIKQPEELQTPPLTTDQGTWTTGDSTPGPPGEPGPAVDSSLGMAESGEGGGDVFGLVGKPAGRELLLTRGAGGGSRGDPSASFGRFAGEISEHLRRELNAVDALRKNCFSAEVDVRVLPSGEFASVDLRSSNGRPEINEQLRAVLATVRPLGTAGLARPAPRSR